MGQALGPFDKVFLVKAEVPCSARSFLNALTRFSLTNWPILAILAQLTRSPLSNWPILAHLTRKTLSNWPIGPFDKENLVKWVFLTHLTRKTLSNGRFCPNPAFQASGAFPKLGTRCSRVGE